MMCDDDKDDIPQSVSEGTQEILGLPMRSYVLDDGRRVFHADDVHRLLRSMLFDEKPDDNDNKEP